MSEIIDSGVVEVGLDLSSIDKQLDGLSQDISGAVEKGFGGAGDKAAASLSGGLKKGLGAIQQGVSAAMSAVGVAAGGALATSLYKGFQRYTTIEDSLISMETQLGSATRAATMLDEVLDVVRGTPFNLDQFADAASRMVSFGAEAEKIPGYLEAIGEVSATKGGRANEFAMRLSTSFGQIAAMGRITNEEINQMSQAGVPAIRILANEFDVTTVQAKEMISEGIIPANEAMDALTKGILEGTNGLAGATPAMAGTMEGLRDTMTGALGGMQSAMARFGAEIVSQLAPGLTAVFNATAAVWDKLTASIEGFSLDESSVMQTIIEFLEKIANSDTGALDDIFDTLSSISSLAAPLAAMSGAQGLGAIAGIIPGLSGLIGPLTGGIGTLVIGLGALLATNEEFMASLSGMGSQLMDAFTPLMETVMGPLVDLMDILSDTLASLIQTAVPLINGLMLVLKPILDIIIEVVGAVLQGFVPAFENVGAMFQRIQPSFQKLADSLGELAEVVGPLVSEVMNQMVVQLELMMPFTEQLWVLILELGAALIDMMVALAPIAIELMAIQTEMLTAVSNSKAFADAVEFVTWTVEGLVLAAKWAADALGWISDKLGLGPDQEEVDAMNAAAEATLAAAAAKKELEDRVGLVTEAIGESLTPVEAWKASLEDSALAYKIFQEDLAFTGPSPLWETAPQNFVELADAIGGLNMGNMAYNLERGEEGLAQLEQQMIDAGVPAAEMQFAMDALGLAVGSAAEEIDSTDFGSRQAEAARAALNEFNEEIVLFLDQLEGIKSAAFGEAIASEFATGKSSMLSMQLAAWDTQDVFDNFKGALEGVGGWAPDGTTFDATRDGARELYEAALPLQQMLGEDLMEAYDAANADPLVDGLDAAQAAAEEFGAEMAAGLGIEVGTAEYEEFLKVLGATPEQVETTINVAGQIEAEKKLDLLGDVIGGLPTEIQQTITAQIMEDDYTGAIATAEAAIADGVDTPIIPLTPEVDEVVKEMTEKFAENPPDVPVFVVEPTDQYETVHSSIKEGIGEPQITVRLNYVQGNGTSLLNQTTRNMTVGTTGVGTMGVGAMASDYDRTIDVYGRGGGEVNMVKIEDATFMDGIDLDELAAQVRLGMVLAGESV